MTSKLDCHPASEQETISAHQNVFDVWPAGKDIESHLGNRIASPKSQRADYFVGRVNGQVATALQSFPTIFQVRGEEILAIQIGSVHTHADFRKRGYAEELIDFTEKYQAARGIQLSVLYSDVAPGYYAKMGYQICPSLHGWIQTENQTENQPEKKAKPARKLVELTLADNLQEIQELHDRIVRQRPIGILRDAAYWEYTRKKFPNDLWYGLRDESARLVACIRLNESSSRLSVADQFCLEDSGDLLCDLLSGSIQIGRQRRISEVGGWLPDDPKVKELTTLQDRPKQITMFKSLTENLVLDQEILDAANYFTLIDHV